MDKKAKKDIFNYDDEDYIFLSHYGLNSKIYGRGKKRILVEDNRVIFFFSDPEFRSINA